VAEKLGYEREVKCCDDYLLKDQMLISDYWRRADRGITLFRLTNLLSFDLSIRLLECDDKYWAFIGCNALVIFDGVNKNLSREFVLTHWMNLFSRLK
jgi:hypothetical protein